MMIPSQAEIISRPLILGMDIGTSSLRASLFDESGATIAATLAQQKYHLHTDPNGAAELSIKDLEMAMAKALSATLNAKRQNPALIHRPIAGVGLSCFWHSLLGYNQGDEPPSPVLTWADSRCHTEANLLRKQLSEKLYHRRTGCMLRTSFWPAKLLWVRNNQDFQGYGHWASPADWLLTTYCETASQSLSMASGTGLFNPGLGCWDSQILKESQAEVESLLPVSNRPHLLSKRHHSAYPELIGVPWFPAIGDGAASNLGSDAAGNNAAVLNFGTSAALRIMRPRTDRSVSFGLFKYLLDETNEIVGGAISNAGNLREWALNNLNVAREEGALEQIMRAPASSLTVVPYWTIERAPDWPDLLGGSISGLTYSTSAADLFNAIVDSTYHRLASIADLMESSLKMPRFDILVSGGINHSPASLQRLANILNRPVRLCVEKEASLRGAAVYAGKQLGLKIGTLPMGALIAPDAKMAEAYAKQKTSSRRC